ncbi:hypothetical protein HanHA300_Chr03g0096691 [Helianthus annuus]|nr:hypothetical protein HanHA300_Chr03g0096691 [Helianthus annuus]KAJ0608423.1 hypothetical protein HanHA89_Chr03g0108381 [Helianthus annuus]KAJ0768486.1 hypothetical protein HanLR1_Chr03g0101741 [Helianthus annuus]
MIFLGLWRSRARNRSLSTTPVKPSGSSGTISYSTCCWNRFRNINRPPKRCCKKMITANTRPPQTMTISQEDSENVSEKISRFSKYKASVFLRKLRIFPFIKLWLPCGNWNFTRISQSNEAFFKFLQPTIQTWPVSSS